MKSCMASGSDAGKPEKFLAYMVPAPDEVTLPVSLAHFLLLEKAKNDAFSGTLRCYLENFQPLSLIHKFFFFFSLASFQRTFMT